MCEKSLAGVELTSRTLRADEPHPAIKRDGVTGRRPGNVWPPVAAGHRRTIHHTRATTARRPAVSAADSVSPHTALRSETWTALATAEPHPSTAGVPLHAVGKQLRLLNQVHGLSASNGRFGWRVCSADDGRVRHCRQVVKSSSYVPSF